MAGARTDTKRTRIWAKPNLGLRLPGSGTEALQSYLKSFAQINEFLHFVLGMVSHIERTAKKMRELKVVLEKVVPPEESVSETEWRGPLEDLKKHRQLFLEILLVRHVENYLNFLSSLLRVVFLSRPEVLRSAEKIDLETVFRHASIDDLVKTVAERKVESLSYSSFSDLAAYFDEKFHIELVRSDDLSTVVEAIETRNISVHNRCVVNQRFVTRTGLSEAKIGKTRSLGIEDVERIAVVLTRSALAVDKAARKSLSVRGVRFGAAAAP